MTATELQNMARILSNQTWRRYWLNYNNSKTDVKMAIQCRNCDGIEEPISGIHKLGFKEDFGHMYFINRTNEDGTPFELGLF